MKAIIASFLFCVSFPAWAFKVPSLVGPVMDQAGMLHVQDEASLERLLRDVQRKGIAQIQVLTVPNLQGETIEQASIQIVDKWKLGSEKGDNGVLILVSREDRKVRIEVGQGLEGAIPDITAKRIVSDVMIPFFRQGDFSQGIVAGTLAVIQAASPEGVSEEYVVPEKKGLTPFSKLFIGFMLFVFIMSLIKNPVGTLALIAGMGSGRRRGYGGGGGWSGGGGGFSGGGASGGW